MNGKDTQSDNENYIMRQPKFVFWIGIICTLIFLILFAIVPIVGSEDFSPFVIIGFSSFVGLGVFLAVYAAKWKIIVENDTYHVFIPFCPARTVTLSEITQVRQKYNGLIVYTAGKKAFAVDNIVNGFDIFRDRLYRAGKMEATQCKGSFVVRQNKGNLITGILGMIFGISMLIWIIFWPDETVNCYMYILFSSFSALSLYLILNSLLWKITVSGDMLTAKKIIGGEKQYNIRDITEVSIGRDKITLSASGKKIVKVEKGCEGFSILVERLDSKKIPFYYKGKIIE